jgi:hypothetical protein
MASQQNLACCSWLKMAKKHWIEKVISKPGALTKQAKRAGYPSALPFAKDVVAGKIKANPVTVHRSHLAIQLNKYKKK